ncbi:uncharacterized protein LOC119113828 [Pollicipes pollicipes]|uniref:uncharacterized protein LOC119113828 n=1 Tax=Pollicipes pollicipes TaxID=41117 RepID=UPI001884DD85|nr:uncharacterized protein LOC119113828 [Pollicipes pollicipes]XP_037093956.1 uncharacterized protein LOC119113828 [Pollicipes pollicipes]
MSSTIPVTSPPAIRGPPTEESTADSLFGSVASLLLRGIAVAVSRARQSNVTSPDDRVTPPAQLVTSAAHLYDKLTSLVDQLRPALAEALHGGLSNTSPIEPRRDVRTRRDVTSRSASRSGRVLGIFKPKPPPPPPRFPPAYPPYASPGYAKAAPALDSGAAGGAQVYYDYSRLRNDVSYYSSVLEVVFTLMLALFGVLLVPVLVPVFTSLVAPNLLADLLDKLTEVKM